MWIESSKYYDESFKTKVVEMIHGERPVFREAHSVDREMEFGHRFQDVNQVWQATCMVLERSIDPKIRGIAVAHLQGFYIENPAEMKLLVWEALKLAAETDWYYTHEKVYYEAPYGEEIDLDEEEA